METITKDELSRLRLFGKNVLIQLPEDTDNKERELKSGISVSFIYSDKEKYAPVQGIVVRRSPKLEILRDGDHVFFHYLCWGNAQHTAEQLKNGHYDGTKIALECEGTKYLLLSETEIMFAKRGERFVSMNDYLLLRAIPKGLREEIIKDARGYNVGKVWVSDSTSSSSIVMPDVTEPYRLDIAEVVCCPEGMGCRVGDIIYPDRHFDVPLEYDILQTLDERIFYTHKDVILGKKVEHEV